MSSADFKQQYKGSRSSFLERWVDYALSLARQPGADLGPVADETVDMIAAKENLKIAWDDVAERGGPAAGPNRQTFRDFSRMGAWREIERLHKALIEENYRHGDVLETRIPKRPGSSGTRPLSIPDVQDRVVGRAEVQIIEPLFRLRFDERSFCRFGRGPGHALAHAQQIAEGENRWIWIAEDICGAFDNVPLPRLFEVFFSYLPSDRLLDLIRRSVDDRRESGGLYQGAPLSPLLMNIYLDAMIDRPWCRLHPNVPLLRFMDDLLVLCHESDDVDQLYRDLAALVEAAQLQLKYSYPKAVHALREQTATWLGFRFRRGVDGLEIRLPFVGRSREAKEWRRYLRERFVTLHEASDSPFASARLLQGIISWAAPTLPWTNTRDAYEVLRKAARYAAFEEIPTCASLQRRWHERHQAWHRHCVLDVKPAASAANSAAWEDHELSDGEAPFDVL